MINLHVLPSFIYLAQFGFSQVALEKSVRLLLSTVHVEQKILTPFLAKLVCCKT